MVTQVNLYNRYRPQNLNEIVGQESISRILSNAILKKRIANAYLLRGSRGSGKTSVARILCKAANCEQLKGFTVCGTCNGCKFALHDAIELDAASNRGIDAIKELLDTLRFRPQHVDKKFIIIDEAHQLTSAALNALLKVVEEPPKYVHFVFCTTENPSSATDIDKAFVTLSSRCQILQFKKVRPKAMLDKLARICIAEDRTVSRGILMSIVGKSDGSLRDAENILDIVLTLQDSEPPEHILQFLYGDIELITCELFENLCIGTLNDCLLLVRKLWDSGANPIEVAEFMVKFVTDSIYLQSELTVYRASDTVKKLKEISNNIEQSKLNSIAEVFTGLQRSGRDELLSLELAICDIFINANDDRHVFPVTASNIEVW
jgi:DNA polymerase-3 subunit gamma/tau